MELDGKLLIGNNSNLILGLKLGGDPIPTPFISMVNQASETKFHYQFKANHRRVTRIEKQPLVADRVVTSRAKLGEGAYRCKPDEGLLLTSEGVKIVKIL